MQAFDCSNVSACLGSPGGHAADALEYSNVSKVATSPRKAHAMKLPSLSILALSLLCLATTAQAQTYQVSLTGTVFQVDGSYWDPSVALGTTVNMTFTFDASAFPTTSVSTTAGYTFESLSATVSVGNYSATSDFQQLAIYDNALNGGTEVDGYFMNGAVLNPLQTNIDLRDLSFDADFITSATSLLSSTQQPVQQFDLSAFAPSIPVLGITGTSSISEYNAVWANVTSYSVSAVPEPSTYALIAGAVMGAAALVARRRKVSQA